MVDWERVIRDVGKLRASLGVKSDTEGAVERWDARHNKAFGRRTRAARIAGGVGTGRWYGRIDSLEEGIRKNIQSEGKKLKDKSR
jgi:hypothetical protein